MVTGALGAETICFQQQKRASQSDGRGGSRPRLRGKEPRVL